MDSSVSTASSTRTDRPVSTVVRRQREVLTRTAGSYARYCLVHLILGWLWTLKGCYRARKREYRDILWDRLTGKKLHQAPKNGVVLYTIGIGEARVAAKIVQVLNSREKTPAVILCETDDLLRLDYKDVAILPAPFNNPVSAWRALKLLKPSAIWFVETSKNHHLKVMAAILGIPTVMFNVHQSVADAVQDPDSKWRVPMVGLFAVQTARERSLLTRDLVEPEFVVETGPFGLGRPETATDREQARSGCKIAFGLERAPWPVILAGSTHSEDETVVLDAFRDLRKQYGDAVLILAPRQVRRSAQIISECHKRGLGSQLRSSLKGSLEHPVLVLDTLGELRDAYSIADLAFVGGTFAKEVGGHTPMEALCWEVPVTSGPYFEHQAGVAALLEGRDLWKVVHSSNELVSVWQAALSDPDCKQRICEVMGSLNTEFDRQTLRSYDQLRARYLA